MKPARPPARPLVSIIIPVFNKCDLTLQCLAALHRVTRHLPHEVIVVDNASSDATPRLVPERAPQVRYLRNETNRNFAGACNQGAEAATGQYLLFLNNDTIPLAGWLDALVEEVRTHAQTVAVGSRLIYDNGLIQHAGIAFGRETRSPFHPYRFLRSDDPRVNHRRELQAVTAACVLIRPKAFHGCGGFNEDFRNGYEDLDLCLHLRRKGGVIVYEPKSALVHLESQTPGRMRHDNENRALFFQRWNDALLADEDAFYLEDNYRIVEFRNDQPEAPRLERLQSAEERDRWSLVARTQILAAARRRDDLAPLLSRTEDWPEDAGIHRWAGVVALRLGLTQAALDHFHASLRLKEDAEVRLHLALWHQSSDSAGAQTRWQSMLAAGWRSLRQQQNAEAARRALETALLRGAPPRLVLPGLWQALEQQQAPDALHARDALLHLPHLDPATEQALQGNGAPCEPNLTSPPPRTRPSAPNPTEDLQPNPPAGASTDLVSIIILVHNQLELTRACLESIARHTPSPHEILVVDNGSTDDTPAWLAARAADHPELRVIRNAANRGFAAGNNQGLAIARGRFVLLLNNDTVVTPGWLDRMLAVCQQHPRTGLVGPRSNRVAGAQLVESPGYASVADLPAFAEDWASRHAGQSRRIARLIGFCLLARREVVEALGGLDERYGSGNFEDDDYCIRARLAGFEARIADDAFVHHVGGQTFAAARINYRDAMLTNWGLFKAKWGIPADAPIERGYRFPTSLPAGTSLRLDLPVLETTHLPDPDQRIWRDRSQIQTGQGAPEPAPTEAHPAPNPQPSNPAPVESLSLPPCALLGHLGPARELIRARRFREAWEATTAALARRPFHPEALLLLGEIALSAGDIPAARLCGQRARDLVPNWKPARKFLKKLPNNGPALRPKWLTLPPSIAQPPATGTPRITVCLIARNEEQFIDRCLASIRPLAHQIIVVDTGSTDRTPEIARSHGAELHTFTWCDDFSAARNAALEHATGDWILALDADEELPADQHARLLSDLRTANSLGCRLPLINAGLEAEGVSYVPRLFRNAPGLFYVCRVHEQIFSSLLVRATEWGMDTGLGTAQILHHGYTPEVVRDRRKAERNLHLLRRALEDFPDDVNLRMNLGLELVRAGEPDNGLDEYRHAVRTLSQQPAAQRVPELRETLLTQFSTQLLKAQRWTDLIDTLQSPVARSAELSASLHFALGLALMRTHRFHDAIREFRQCLAKRHHPALCPILPEIHRAGPSHCLANCLRQLGQDDEALAALQTAQKDDPTSRPVRMDLARLLFQRNEPVSALTLLTDLVAEHGNDPEVWKLGGEIALSRPEFRDFSLDWTAEALKHLPDGLPLAAQRAEALLLAGDSTAALPLWRRVVENAGSETAQAALCLCALAEAESPGPIAPSDERPVSQAFLRWYQRLAEADADAVLLRVNDRLDALTPLLPSATRSLRAAMDAACDAACGGV